MIFLLHGAARKETKHEGSKVWADYFCLRPLRLDFKPEIIEELILETGAVYVFLDAAIQRAPFAFWSSAWRSMAMRSSLFRRLAMVLSQRPCTVRPLRLLHLRVLAPRFPGRHDAQVLH